MDETPPEVPGYRLTDLLGAGATSQVWRARRLTDDEPVAIKVLPGRADEEAVREFALLQHAAGDHVVALHETLALDGPGGPSTALVLELLAGGGLDTVVAARGHLTPGETVTVIAPIAQALTGLHDLGVVHGDLSPGNVLLDATGRPVLTDLGYSRLTGEAPGAVHGTDGYVAPEVLEGSDPSRASDVHALGALGWLCLTGSPPGHIVERTELGACVDSPDLVAAIEAALASDPASRPEADEVARAVFDAAVATPLRMTTPGDVASGLTRRIRESAGALEVPQWQQELVDASEPAPRRRWWHRRSGTKGAPRPRVERAPRSADPARVAERDRRRVRRTGAAAEVEHVRGAGGRHAAPKGADPRVPLSAPRRIARAATERTAPGHRGLVVAGALGLVLAVLVPWQQLASAGGDSDGAGGDGRGVATAAAAPDDGSDVLADRSAPQQAPTRLARELTALRQEMVLGRDADVLAELDEPGSPAARRDRELIEQLTASGVRYEDVELGVRTAQLERSDGRVAVLRTTTDEGAYSVIGADGQVEERPARHGQQADLVLVWHEGAWRVRDVR